MTTVELDSLWSNQEFQQLLEAAEQSGSVRHAELAEVLEPHELGLLETDAVYRELDQRGIEVIEETKEAGAPATASAACRRAGDDDRRAAALPAGGRAAIRC
jgi:hypothetical protein